MKMTRAMIKRRCKNYQVVDNFFIYSLTALTCSVFCSSPFWFPYLLSSTKAFLFVSLPKVGMVLLSHKVLFFVGNLIIIILIGESKLFASGSSPASDLYYDDYVSKSQSVQNSSSIGFTEDNNKEMQREKCLEELNLKRNCGGDGDNVVKNKWVKEEVENGNIINDEDDKPSGFPAAEELSKRADDFIARVNGQRRLEARLLLSCSEVNKQ